MDEHAAIRLVCAFTPGRCPNLTKLSCEDRHSSWRWECQNSKRVCPFSPSGPNPHRSSRTASRCRRLQYPHPVPPGTVLPAMPEAVHPRPPPAAAAAFCSSCSHPHPHPRHRQCALPLLPPSSWASPSSCPPPPSSTPLSPASMSFCLPPAAAELPAPAPRPHPMGVGGCWRNRCWASSALLKRGRGRRGRRNLSRRVTRPGR